MKTVLHTIKKVVSISVITASCLAACLVLTAAKTDSSATAGKPRVEDMSKGPVQVTVTTDPPVVRIDRDMIMTIRISSPSEIEVTMPAMDDRLKGFLRNGTLDKEPVTHAGKTTCERQLLLTPLISDEYRLAPFPVVYTDKGKSPAETMWFATRPVVFDTAPVINGKADKDIGVNMTPVWIYPTFKTVSLYLLLGLAVVALIFLAWKLLKRVHRQIRLMRMSPRERALEELAELIKKDLIGKNLVKEFYLEITMIVRRYIERAHSIRAPEQTTEEFLAAVSSDTRFSRDVLKKLKAFLEAADLVKFAAYRPDQDAISNSTETARGYIETDAADQGTGSKEQKTENSKGRSR